MAKEEPAVRGSRSLVKRVSNVPPAAKRTAVVAAPALLAGGGLIAAPTVAHGFGDIGPFISATGHEVGTVAGVGVAAGAVLLAGSYAANCHAGGSPGRYYGVFGTSIAASSALGIAVTELAHASPTAVLVGGGIGAIGGVVTAFSIGVGAEDQNTGLPSLTTQSVRLRNVSLASLSIGAAAVASDFAERIGAHPIPLHTLGATATVALTAGAMTGVTALVQRHLGRREHHTLGE